jgi:hypothetical protein
MNQAEAVDLAVKAIVLAWLVEGKSPYHHHQAQAKLWAEWPTLAKSIDDLVKVIVNERRVSDRSQTGEATQKPAEKD